jgi:hypothetical protein
MRRSSLILIAFGGISVLILYHLIATRESQEAAQPLVQAAGQPMNADYPVGSICPGETIGHEFQYQNRTSSRLHILSDADIQVGCGCSSLTPSAREIEPGETVRLSLTARTESFRKPFSVTSSVT